MIDVYCFGAEIGKLTFDEHRAASIFQYNKKFLDSGRHKRLFPLNIRRISQPQIFARFAGETFRALPPAIADSLPDAFGNKVFQAWFNSSRAGDKLTVAEQLAYVGNRGMGALEYHPSKDVVGAAHFNLAEIEKIAALILTGKQNAVQGKMDSEALINIFRLGTSAGGLRPKVLVARNLKTGAVIPGDVLAGPGYEYLLVKLGVEENLGYSREILEFIYHGMAQAAGIDVMPASLIDGRHFAVCRFDRVGGEKQHILTATGIAGLDFKSPGVSTYENLFDLAIYLQLPQADIDELFRRMVFNVVFANYDDHLKNHSFRYNTKTDSWALAPAYDITYSLNPELNFFNVSRALSINGKRTSITFADIVQIAEKYTVKTATSIVEQVQAVAHLWLTGATQFRLPEKIVDNIQKDFLFLV